MPFLTREYYKDEYGIVHPKGLQERCDMITNPIAFVNRTIPISLEEGSITFILDITRKHAATLETYEEKKEFLFDVLGLLNPNEEKELEDIYNNLSDREKKHFIDDMISLNPDGSIRTDNGMYFRWEAFSDTINVRDNIIKVYEKYGDIIKPYHIFVPKPKWGRDIYIGDDCVGFQYMMVLKQSGKKGFSVRSAGAISDEGLPEKSNDNKSGLSYKSSKPIRFGEWIYTLTLNLSNCGNGSTTNSNCSNMVA